MKKLSLLLALLLVGCASPVTKAPWKSYPGALRENQCQRYAVAAQEDLTLRGVNAFYISYSWSSGNNTGRHAVVIFQDENGYFLVDNVMAWPVHVRGETVLDLIKCYDRSAYIVWQSEDCPLKLNWF